MKLILSITMCLTFSFPVLASQTCDIYIHGYTAEGVGYFGDLPRQVIWDSSQEIEVAAPDVATKILEQMQTCPADAAIVLRPHSYGAAQVHFILSKGHLFQDLSPEHPYVEIYRRTIEVYSYTGAYQGTPLMDLVCANAITRKIGEFIGKACVRTLTTSPVDNVAAKATTPGVPIHLITSSNRSGYYNTTGTIISKHMVGFFDFILGRRNQNDNTLPLYSTRACAEQQLMPKEDSKCEKLDGNYFIDFYHTTELNHNEFLKDEAFMGMTSDEE